MQENCCYYEVGYYMKSATEIRARGTAMLKLAPTEVRESWAHFLAAADEILEKI